ncbi:hypothetical protein HanRHA438_Chr06g0283581 [Helianthus annuus]|nr:hypothetical protein HanIR_Chr06g0295121 [Helianthus annuus]KAJ0913257.1 hypothetical protein HanRHA438_Chr06g0283581 [Helianthus annuus]
MSNASITLKDVDIFVYGLSSSTADPASKSLLVTRCTDSLSKTDDFTVSVYQKDKIQVNPPKL